MARVKVPGITLEGVYPGAHWETRSPDEVGLSAEKLDRLAELVGGRGCIVRRGYLAYSWGDASRSGDVASAVKPVLSTLLLIAVEEKKLRSVDDEVAEHEPRLRGLNGGKDGAITWRHLASQTSGYGLQDAPGKAYSYNDFALALYHDVLMGKVFRENGTEVLRTRIAAPLQFEDPFTLEAFGPSDRPGRLAVSPRDLARLGLLYLRRGKWRDREILRPESIRMALSSPVPPEMPVSAGKDAEMLPGQRTLGGGKSITPVGPGFYSFNWWVNGKDKSGRRLFSGLPEDAFAASGHGGERLLWVIPSLDLIVSWNDSRVSDQDETPGSLTTRLAMAAGLLAASVVSPPAGGAAAEEGREAAPGDARSTRLGIDGSRFTVDGKPTFLLGVSYYGGLGAADDSIDRDLDDMARRGVNWIRVWATWAAFGKDASAVDGEGRPRKELMEKLQSLVARCDRRGMVVDVTLSRGNGVTGPTRLGKLDAHLRAVEAVAAALRSHRNWYLDLSNERNIGDERFTSFADLKALREAVRDTSPDLLVTASHGGDIAREDIPRYVLDARVDFITPHRPRDPQSPAGTEAKTREYLEWMREAGRTVPVHYQEPLRRGYAGWAPGASDFEIDLRGAVSGGAAGWCFHNGSTRDAPDGAPRRSFDLSGRRLFETLDSEEQKFLDALRGILPALPAPVK